MLGMISVVYGSGLEHVGGAYRGASQSSSLEGVRQFVSAVEGALRVPGELRDWSRVEGYVGPWPNAAPLFTPDRAEHDYLLEAGAAATTVTATISRAGSASPCYKVSIEFFDSLEYAFLELSAEFDPFPLPGKIVKASWLG